MKRLIVFLLAALPILALADIRMESESGFAQYPWSLETIQNQFERNGDVTVVSDLGATTASGYATFAGKVLVDGFLPGGVQDIAPVVTIVGSEDFPGELCVMVAPNHTYLSGDWEARVRYLPDRTLEGDLICRNGVLVE